MIVVVHQPLLWVLHRANLVPWHGFDFSPLPPFGVPAMANAVFWGALWGPVIEILGRRQSGRRHAVAAAGTALLTTAVGAALVATGHQPPMRTLAPTAAIAWSIAVNGGWAGATSLLLSWRAADTR